jgi:cation diffusion facilitator family transporter
MNKLKTDNNHPPDSSKSVRFVTLVGLLFNLFLAGLKFYAGYFGRSQALIADAVHSLSDTVSDVAIIVGSYYWSKPADKQHPYGHRRIETIITIFVGLILLLAGFGIINEAVESFRGEERQVPKLVAVVAAFLSIVTKEILYRWTLFYGEKVKSQALMANAWHHRTDAFSSIPALIATGGIIISPSWVFLDQIGAIIISLFIFHAAYEIIYTGIKELIDSGAPLETCNTILSLVRQVSGVKQVHGLRTRFAGSVLYVDLHVLVESSISVKKGHDIAEDVKGVLLGADLDIIDTVVHVEPLEEKGVS